MNDHSENQQGPNEQLLQAIVSGKRPERPSAFSSTLTFSQRALLRIKHVPEQLFDVTVFPVIFLLMFTFLFGGAIAGSTGEYLQFLLPGILVMTVVQITMYTGLDLNKDIQNGIFDRFRTMPLWLPSALVGGLLIDVFRYTIASVIMIILGYILGFRPEGGLSGVSMSILLILLFCFSVSWIWTTLGLIMRSEKSLMLVSMMVLFPLTFISNVFVAPETLPNWLQAFVDVNPISLLVNAVRGFMHGTITTEAIMWVFLTSGIIFIIFAPITMYLYRNKK
ncbi:ABC transporter [Alkalihalobacillus alcalophilus ATCC 27647 = CGMCC 1.3604]|uniref:Transport permease protein n=1 Tax=Alkalihalobacillus alcalophilus ATCC 27647 = CGMCC 1.3604 TaxID=1218173 RepID=J8TFY6_ALKAL|nr:ABC transporter permease [Alkalihalobacillus alcalophilus]AFV25938.1 multidrug transporter [Alkalihalobacillus alcalophilus ATCC 27647 = CGMCC 1.3604]MED1562803.1 ABC transporter permease [Alkalihalobacillus alcalophilus]THG91514.1 ABC transporter [Alkalihalobacillus alcalophilus ATCC 27647 = CGMCC 1.3604]